MLKDSLKKNPIGHLVITSLLFLATLFAQENATYTLTIKDENGAEVGQYFDIQIDNLSITVDTTINIQMIPNVGIEDSTLREKYSTFLEMLIRSTGKELEAVLDENDIIGTFDSNHRSWGELIEVNIGNEFNGTDDLVREVIDELNLSLGKAYFKEVSQTTTKGWNFDYSNVDWKIDRAITRNIQFENDNTPKNCTFLIHGLFEYPNDFKSRLRKQITEILLLNTNYDKEFIKTISFDEKLFPITAFSNDLVNVLQVLSGLQNGRVYDFDINEHNKFPIANAGMVKNDNLVGQLVTLDGTSSLDPDGNILTYNWKQLFGTKVGTEYITSNKTPLSDSTSPTPFFTTQWPGNYRFQLTVTDYNGFSNTDYIDVQVVWDESPISIKGINAFAYYEQGFLNSFTADFVEELANYDQAEWIEFSPYWWMQNQNSNDLHPLGEWYAGSPGFTIPDTILIELINIFHSKGMKVFLRPTLEFHNWVDWRGTLEPTDWDSWFLSYENFITHYASIAEQTSVELFSVGNELKNSNGFTEKWTDIIAKVRNVYSGALTYSDSELIYGISLIKFWDKLDIIGTGFYPPITGKGGYWDTGFQEMYDPPFHLFIQSLENWINEFLLPVHQRYQKQILITEAGCTNVDGANLLPWFYTFEDVTLDNKEQADYYEALMQVISNKEWISGVFMFVYDLKLDYNFVLSDWPFAHNPRFKPAREVVRVWYQSK